MALTTLDWIIIVSYFLLSLAIGLYFTKTASKSISDFFLGGRNMTWWLAGVSMVATTFAADTPLAITELVSKYGIAGNWLWWNALVGGMLTVFFFAKLWRRAEILTDVEFIEFRYAGKAAAFLRGFRAVYLGVFMNAVIIGWVNLALVSILRVFFDLEYSTALALVAGAMVLTMIYSSLAGLLGVAVTDFIQFFIAMAGCIVLAIIVINSEKIGGITGLKEKLPDWSIQFFPKVSTATPSGFGQTLTLSISTFISFVAFQWWASWYPGAEPGGGGYVAQRMMGTKNEKHAILSSLFFQVANYCLRPWPWILVGLCAIILYPDLQENEKGLGYIYAMKDFLPSGFRGLLLVAFFSAYMSTISTQLNWGASYLVNDLYKRFIEPNAAEKKLVIVSKLATVVMMALGLFITTQLQTISDAWYFLLQASAGLGLVLILRWYWWRVNAWSEIIATIAPLLTLVALTALKKYVAYNIELGHSISEYPFVQWLQIDPNTFFTIVAVTTVAWIAATMLTKPTDETTLIAFYKKIRPQGAWGPIKKLVNIPPAQASFKMLLICWISGIIFTYSMLFLFGKLIFQEWEMFFIYSATAIVSGLILLMTAKKVKIFED